MECKGFKLYNTLFMMFMGGFFGLSISLLVQASFQKSDIPSTDAAFDYVVDQLQYDGKSIQTFGSSISSYYVAVGVFTFLTAIYGYTCNIINCFRKMPKVYYVFSIVVIPLVIMQIVALSLYYPYAQSIKDKFVDGGEYNTTLVTDIFNNFEADTITTSTNAKSAYWNLFFMRNKCCAVNAVAVGDRGDFEVSLWYRSGAASSQKIPTSCCVDATESAYSAATACKDNVDADTYYSTGCLSVLRGKFDFSGRQTSLLIHTVIEMALEITLAIVAFFLAKAIQQSDCGGIWKK